jgi:hypothetical protein
VVLCIVRIVCVVRIVPTMSTMSTIVETDQQIVRDNNEYAHHVTLWVFVGEV